MMVLACVCLASFAVVLELVDRAPRLDENERPIDKDEP